MALTKFSLGQLIELTTETNADNKYGANNVKGMTITKEIIPTKADVSNTDLTKFLVIKPGEFVFNPRTHGKKIGFGYNNSNENFIISWNNTGFKVKDEMLRTVLPEYLFYTLIVKSGTEKLVIVLGEVQLKFFHGMRYVKWSCNSPRSPSSKNMSTSTMPCLPISGVTSGDWMI